MSRALMLGEVIERLERLSPDLRCTPAFGEPDSWRGDYACIAFGPRESATVREMLSCAKAADDATFTGYKGGDYRMTRKTECYVAAYGEYGGEEEDALSTDNFPWLIVPGSVEQLRAALAAAEAKLELQGYEYTKALAETELALGADIHALEVKLADERRHSEALYAKGSMALTTLLNGHRDDGVFLLRGLVAAHAARRAAEVAPKPAPAKRADAGPFGKWEIEPALSCSFDLQYTNDDDEAFDIATKVLERLWDDMEPGDTRTLRITLNAEVPRG